MSDANSIESTANTPAQAASTNKTEGMSRRSIITTLMVAVATSIALSTIGYVATKKLSFWFGENLLPIEPCMLIAIFSATAGCAGYLLQQRWFPGRT